MADRFGALPALENEFNIWKEESTHAKILRQFNTPKSQGGFKNDGFEEFPKMLYMARQHPVTRKWVVSVDRDETVMVGMQEKVTLDAQAFTKTCQLEVKDHEMQDKAIRAGWRLSQGEAMREHEDQVLAAATAAAERNYQDRNMSIAAQAQAARFEATTPDHVAVIPEAPRRRGRPKKVQPQSA